MRDEILSYSHEKYVALGDMANKLNCDGFEFMVDSTMYKNVVCNNNNPFGNMRRVHEAYWDATFVFGTKMAEAEFHNQTVELFSTEWDWLL